MSLFSLFSDERGFLATDQLVYTSEQIKSLQDAAGLAAELSAAIDEQSDQCEASKSAGYVAGYDQGIRVARNESAVEIQHVLAELHQAYQRDVSRQQEACASLAVDIVRKIAGQFAPADWIYAEASTAAAELVDQTELTLRVHSSQLDELTTRIAQSNVFDRVVADETVAPDGCSIETRYGKIDVDLETQIEQVLKLFTTSAASESDDG